MKHHRVRSIENRKKRIKERQHIRVWITVQARQIERRNRFRYRFDFAASFSSSSSSSSSHLLRIVHNAIETADAVRGSAGL